MDWSKYPLEKLFTFVAGIIPGFIALLISHDSLRWFFALEFLGYRTKVALVVLVAFVVGFTMTTFLNAFLGGVGGAIGGATYKVSFSYAIAPWRDPRWRELVKQKLGVQSPEDTRPMSPTIFDLRSKIIENLPKDEQPSQFLQLHQERLRLESDDLAWAQWYDHYHKVILLPETKDVVWHVNRGLSFSIQTAALYVLISAIVTPSVRHWWYIAPASIWVLLLILQSSVEVKNALDKWSTLNEQIKHLSSIGGTTI